ncbi:MAG TPA: fumarylacetoacetate hydrolase family protein [Burkholderiales bacterium]|nr:fumarylacetoacetate hydrolase family protein [Burkholderiales bacterium]
MRLVGFGGGRLGIVEGESLRDVTDWAFAGSPRRVEDPLVAFIEARAAGGSPSGPLLAAAGVKLGPPILRPGKIIAAAANYERHTREMNPGVAQPGGIREKGFFLKAPSSIIGPGDAIRLPYRERRTDQEAELAVVMGRAARAVPADEALGHVFGYTCLLDITVRGKEDRGLRKSFDTFTPLGPALVTADEIADPNALAISCRVNGELRQNDSTASMTMPVAELIAWISSVMTLEPGDVIATGTPAGVGPLAPGDRVEVAIERLGTLAVTVAA